MAIYLPRYQNPFMAAAPTLMSNMILQNLSQKFRREELEKDRQHETAKERRLYLTKVQEEGRDVWRGDAKKPPEGYTQSPYDTTTYVGPKPPPNIQPVSLGGNTIGYMLQQGNESQFIKANKPDALPSRLQQYEYAQKQGYQGTVMDFLKDTASKTEINIGDKLAEYQGKKTISRKEEVKSPDFRSKVAISVKAQLGEEWSLLKPFEREEAIFNEMDKRVKETYDKRSLVFGEKNGVEGWYDGQTGELVRKYAGDRIVGGDKGSVNTIYNRQRGRYR